VLQRIGFIDESGKDKEPCLEIKITYGSGRLWRLWAPTHLATPHEWRRIAECFRPAYAAALKKWHREHKPVRLENPESPFQDSGYQAF